MVDVFEYYEVFKFEDVFLLIIIIIDINLCVWVVLGDVFLFLKVIVNI